MQSSSFPCAMQTCQRCSEGKTVLFPTHNAPLPAPERLEGSWVAHIIIRLNEVSSSETRQTNYVANVVVISLPVRFTSQPLCPPVHLFIAQIASDLSGLDYTILRPKQVINWPNFVIRRTKRCATNWNSHIF